MPEYLGKGGSLEYMSTVIFHFLFCFRILLVIIERNPCRFLSKVHTKSSCSKGTMTTMRTWRMPRPPVPLFWECVCFCSWVGAGFRSILPAPSTHRYTHNRLGSLDLAADLISLCLGKNQWLWEAPMGGWGCRSIAGQPPPTSSNRHGTNSSWQPDESHLGWGNEYRSWWIVLANWF